MDSTEAAKKSTVRQDRLKIALTPGEQVFTRVHLSERVQVRQKGLVVRHGKEIHAGFMDLYSLTRY